MINVTRGTYYYLGYDQRLFEGLKKNTENARDGSDDHEIEHYK